MGLADRDYMRQREPVSPGERCVAWYRRLGFQCWLVWRRVRSVLGGRFRSGT